MNINDTSAADHERYMRRCIELAKIAQSRNNTAVGSVVVIDGTIVGEGIEEVPGGINVTGHAEVLACQAAAHHTHTRLLHGASLYTTAEPCFMCSYVIRQCGMSLVAYGLDTPIVGGVSSSMPVLTDASLSEWMPPPHILKGVLHEECRKLKVTTIEMRENKS